MGINATNSFYNFYESHVPYITEVKCKISGYHQEMDTSYTTQQVISDGNVRDDVVKNLIAESRNIHYSYVTETYNPHDVAYIGKPSYHLVTTVFYHIDRHS